MPRAAALRPSGEAAALFKRGERPVALVQLEGRRWRLGVDHHSVEERACRHRVQGAPSGAGGRGRVRRRRAAERAGAEVARQPVDAERARARRGGEVEGLYRPATAPGLGPVHEQV